MVVAVVKFKLSGLYSPFEDNCCRRHSYYNQLVLKYIFPFLLAGSPLAALSFLIIFADMAKKLKKTKPEKPGSQNLKPEKEEKINLKQLAKDERTRKITGTIFLLIAVFLFISFISYFFTWKEDQSSVFRGGFSVLFDSDIKVNNLLGRLGAITAHLFIYKWFGIASLLFCTFFFVVGANLLLAKKYFSVWRNLKYVTAGLLVLSVSLAFVFYRAEFPFGGATGKSIVDWLTGFLGNFGAGALLFVTFFAYAIWQFNPSFDLPKRKVPAAVDPNPDDTSLIPVIEEMNTKIETGNKKNGLKNKKDVTETVEFGLIEKEEGNKPVFEPPIVEKEIVEDIMHTHDELNAAETQAAKEQEAIKEKKNKRQAFAALELEIKTKPIAEEDETGEEKTTENLPPYEPTLDLRDYKYPSLDLLETHGSEKIVQDANELENNKNQIIATLRNYAIEIQKISATVGPTVTLYEIVPAAGVRISRIKNLEDDIALSLAALGIRIIAPIPGKGNHRY